jgi:hypothetical protein
MLQYAHILADMLEKVRVFLMNPLCDLALAFTQHWHVLSLAPWRSTQLRVKLQAFWGIEDHAPHNYHKAMRGDCKFLDDAPAFWPGMRHDPPENPRRRAFNCAAAL